MIGICLGDVTGIGPEVTLKALAAEATQDQARYLLMGDRECLHRWNQRLGLQLPLSDFQAEDATARFQVSNPLAEPLSCDLAPGSPAAAQAAIAWLKAGAEGCLQQQLRAMVTAPVNKEAIIRAGIPFVGQTEFLSQLAGIERTAMMLLGADAQGRWLRVALVTTHVPLKLLPNQLTQGKVEQTIELAAQACRDLGLPQARIGVCGFNPHAGEGGELGDEEITVIGPAVMAVRNRGIDAHGPYSADTLFHQVYGGAYEAVVAMYHDQGLVALKMVAFDNGVNWTLGLPFIRTSPDHGTAYDIAGKGIANPASMLAAIRLAKQLAANKR
jgi:4-hydroxythreonine-4-phosphate dehydrogenase